MSRGKGRSRVATGETRRCNACSYVKNRIEFGGTRTNICRACALSAQRKAWEEARNPDAQKVLPVGW